MTTQPIRLATIGEAVNAEPASSCGCGGGACSVDLGDSRLTTDAAQASEEKDAAQRRDVTVSGMTCDHCVSSVTAELTALDGVEDVAVDLVPGSASRVSFTAPTGLADAAVREAVERAGYSLA